MDFLHLFRRRIRPGDKRQCEMQRPLLEALEDRCVPAGPLLIFHDIQTSADGKIAPWYSSNLGVSYDHNLALVWNYWANLPNDTSYGKPLYYSYRALAIGTLSDLQGIGCDQFVMAIDSWIHYYQYTGNAAVLQNAEDIADYYLANSLSPSNDIYGNLPYPCNTDATSDTLVYDGDLVAGPGVLQPDKAGSFGAALVSLYEITGATKYLTAAVNIANTLAGTVNFNADSNNSPWPFRVYSDTGDQPTSVFSSYTTNYGPTLSLFQSLSNLNQGDVTAYKKAFDFVLQWMQYPMSNNQWGPFYLDFRTFS
jgi:hypothetical protein